MPDREKVIKKAERIMCSTVDRDMIDSFCEDVITMLEEHGTEWEHLWDAPDGTFKGRCKKCGFVHFFIEGHDTQYKFCPQCGEQKQEL